MYVHLCAAMYVIMKYRRQFPDLRVFFLPNLTLHLLCCVDSEDQLNSPLPWVTSARQVIDICLHGISLEPLI